MNNSYIDFDIYRVPEGGTAPTNWSGAGKSGILVISTASDEAEADQAFLESILKAAKLSPLDEQVFSLNCAPEERLPLAQICQLHQVHTVLIFGHPLPLLGVRAQLPGYTFLRLGELSLLRAHSLKIIRSEREQNKNEKAGALWKALKAKFL